MSSIFYQEKEFFPIPGFDGYFISKDSQVYSLKTNRIRKPQYNTNGYLELSLNLGYLGGTRRVGIHRLLGMTFIPCDDDYKKLVINHKNGIKTDNRICNLEWVTYRQNAEHAGRYGLTSKCRPICMISYPTLEVTEFPSIVACSRVLGLSKDIISYRLWKRGKVLFPDLQMYIYSEDKEEFFKWYDEKHFTTPPQHYRKAILVRNVLNGTELEFKSLNDAASYLNVSNSTVTSWLKQKNQPVLPGCVQIKSVDDLTPWRHVEDVFKELSDFTKTKVAVVIDKEGVVKVYTSLVSCAKANGLNITALAYRLKSKGERFFSDGKRYAYGSDMQYGPVTQ